MNALQRFARALDGWEKFAILTDAEVEVREAGRALLAELANAPAGIGVGDTAALGKRICRNCGHSAEDHAVLRGPAAIQNFCDGQNAGEARCSCTVTRAAVVSW